MTATTSLTEAKGTFSGNVDDTKVFVGGIHIEADENELKEAMSRYGDVLEVVLMRDRETGRSRGFGFVTFGSPDAAQLACADTECRILNRRAEIKMAVPKSKNAGKATADTSSATAADAYAAWAEYYKQFPEYYEAMMKAYSNPSAMAAYYNQYYSTAASGSSSFSSAAYPGYPANNAGPLVTTVGPEIYPGTQPSTSVAPSYNIGFSSSSKPMKMNSTSSNSSGGSLPVAPMHASAMLYEPEYHQKHYEQPYTSAFEEEERHRQRSRRSHSRSRSRSRGRSTRHSRAFSRSRSRSPGRGVQFETSQSPQPDRRRGYHQRPSQESLHREGGTEGISVIYASDQYKDSVNSGHDSGPLRSVAQVSRHHDDYRHQLYRGDEYRSSTRPYLTRSSTYYDRRVD